jgi:4'-phosphopantetheinyl transferase
LHDLRAPLWPEAETWLSAEERAKVDRMAFPHLRRRQVASAAFVRWVLGHLLAQPAHSLRFSFGPQGKPGLVPVTGWHFNLSHSEDLAVLAVGSQALGVDVECAGRVMHDVPDLVDSLYQPPERHWVMAAEDPSERSRRFLHCWTRKEACIKAVGSGLALAPRSFDGGIGCAPSEARLHWQGSRSLVVGLVDLPADATGALVALAIPALPSG